MSKHYSPFYFIGQSFKSLWRNGVMTFASVLVLTSMLVVMGGFWMLVRNINENLTSLGLQNDIVVMLDSEATDEQIEAVAGRLADMKDGGLVRDGTTGEYVLVGKEAFDAAPEEERYSFAIDAVTHVTKAEALETLRAEDPELYGDITDEDNPLPDKFVLTYRESEKVESITREISVGIDAELGGGVIGSVRGYEQLVNSILSVKRGVTLVFTWFMIALVVASLFIIMNTISLSIYARREEIMIMRYVGASTTFVTLPFVGEGIIIGLFSGTLAYFIEKLVYNGAVRMLTSTEGGLADMITILPFADSSSAFLWTFLGVGVASGIIGSMLSLVKYNKT